MSTKYDSSSKKPNYSNIDGGEGLQSPFKRMICIGFPLMLYYILAFWMPAYWASAATEYCEFRCNNYPVTGGTIEIFGEDQCFDTTFDCLDPVYSLDCATYGCTECILGTQCASYITIESTGLSSIVDISAFSIGCYDSVEFEACSAECEQSCDDFKTMSYLDTGYDFDALMDSLYELFHLSSGRQARQGCFVLKALGICVGFVGCLLGIFSAKKGNKCFGKIAGILLGVGAVGIIVGAIIFISTWFGDLEDNLAAYQWLVLFEWFLPATFALFLSIDAFSGLFSDKEKRVLAFSVPLVIFGISGCVLLAYIANYEPEGLVRYEYPLYDASCCMAAGYFAIGALSVARILIVKKKLQAGATLEFMAAALLAIGGFVLGVGYWMFIDVIFGCDENDSPIIPSCNSYVLPIINGDAIRGSTADVANIPYESQFKCYYVGYSFFVLMMAVIGAYDMDIVSNYKSARR